jgi:mannan polymerase II complex MNN10 subunit
MRDLIVANANREDRITHYIPQWKINAFPKEIPCWDTNARGWEPGSFVVHFAGAWAYIKEDDPTGYLMRRYESHIVHK